MTDPEPAPPAAEIATPEAEKGFFLRPPRPFRAAFALSFLCACAGVLGLVALYHWPAVNVPVYYFTIRPAFLWFGILLPFLLAGAVALRPRWVLAGCLLWVAGFVACEDAVAWVRPFRARATERFETAKMACRSFAAEHGDVETLDIPLRVVGWNLRAGTMGPGPEIAQLAALKPDLALLEEFGWGSHEGATEALKDAPQFADYHFGRANGIAILSRFPIAEKKHDFLPWTCGIWEVQLAPDRRITCVVVHLSPPILKTQLLRGWRWGSVRKAVAEKRAELEEVREMISRQAGGGPVLLAGDFNVPAHYPDLAIAAGGMQEAFTAHGFGWGKTAPAVLPSVRVDLIFLPEEARVYSAFAVPTRHSDHCPMVAEVSLPVAREPAAR